MMTQREAKTVDELLTDALKWRPVSIRACRRTARGLGVRIKRAPPSLIAPVLRYDFALRQGVLYLPTGTPKTRLRWIVHELAEAALGLDLRPTVYYPAGWGTHHDLAESVECLRFGPRSS